MAIERDLYELLYCHDCVIVPEWGGFLTHYRPARLDEARKVVHPPGKDLSFNRNLTRNDGLLADRVARSQGIPFDTASSRIDAQVREWRDALQRSGRVELPYIGIFYLDTERNLQFDPDKRAQLLKDAHGLRPVAAVPLEQPKTTTVVPMPAPVNEEKEATQRVFPVFRAAAVLAALLLGAAALWVGTRLEQEQWSSLLPLDRAQRTYPGPGKHELDVATASLFTLPEHEEGVHVLPLTEGDSITITVDLGAALANTTPVDSTKVVMPVAPVAAAVSEDKLRYHVVGGCFAEPDNAQRFLDDLLNKGYPARSLPPNGRLLPVAYGSYANRSEALQVLEQVRGTESAQAWLLVR